MTRLTAQPLKSATEASALVQSRFPNSQPGRTQTVTGLTLEEAIEQFQNDPQRANLAAKTKDGYRTVFNLAVELWGETKPVRSIMRKDCREYRDLLVRLPPNRKTKFAKLTAKQAADHAEKEGLDIGYKCLRPLPVWV